MSAGRSTVVFSLVAFGWKACFAASTVPCATCSSPEAIAEAGESLLQVQAKGAQASKATQATKAAQAREELPDHLHKLGLQVFSDEEGLNKAVSEAVTKTVTYDGVSLQMAFYGIDNAAQRMGGEDEDGLGYGLDTLLDERKTSDGMINMIDLGGNYGAVSIAVYNKFPGLLRTVVVEPVAITYFFLQWNLWLNNVPSLTREEFTKDASRPGVVALYGGVTDKPEEELLMCAHPEWSMNAHLVQSFEAGMGCDCGTHHCNKVPGITVNHLLEDYFDGSTTLMKMDCEGCELSGLPVLMETIKADPRRIRRLVGELHFPTHDLEDMACQFESGQFFVRICSTEANPVESQPLTCGAAERLPCERDSNNMLVMEGIEAAMHA